MYRRVRCRCAHAKEDGDFYTQLEKHLWPLVDQDLLELGAAYVLGVEEDGRSTAAAGPAELDLLLVLVSADAHRHCAELQERFPVCYQRSHVVPILIRAVADLPATLLGKQFLPIGSVPIQSWSNRDEAWVAVVQEVRKFALVLSIELWPAGGPSEWQALFEELIRLCKQRTAPGVSVQIVSRPAPPSFLCAEVTWEERNPPRQRFCLLALCMEPLSMERLGTFSQLILLPYRRTNRYGEAQLIYTGDPPGDELVKCARKQGIILSALYAFRQWVLDFEPLLESQNRRLRNDQEYPLDLYVPQRLVYPAQPAPGYDDVGGLLDWVLRAQGQLLLILGAPGSGLTFLMRQLALGLGRERSTVTPLLIELRRLEKKTSFESLVAHYLVDLASQRQPDMDRFRYMLKQGLVAVLFDGFGDLVQRVGPAYATDLLDVIMEAVQGDSKVILTSHEDHFLSAQGPTPLGDKLGQVSHRVARLLPFNMGQAAEYLRKLLQDEEEAEAWLRKIQPRLAEIERVGGGITPLQISALLMEAGWRGSRKSPSP